MILPPLTSNTERRKNSIKYSCPKAKGSIFGTVYLFLIYFPFVCRSHCTELRNWNDVKRYTNFSYFYGSQFTSLSNPLSGTAMLEQKKTNKTIKKQPQMCMSAI